jgi:hypothetical protein
MTDVCTVNDPYTCRSREDLVRCLENYYAIIGRPKTQSVGDKAGGETLPQRYDIILRQNAFIDRIMPKLRLIHHLSYVLLDSYYRHGLHEERDGWTRCLLRARLPHKPQTQRERMLLEGVFERLLITSTDMLFDVVNARPERTA